MAWKSKRFGKEVILTHHALARMQNRSVSDSELKELIEAGELRYKTETHLWIYRAFPKREDNLLCAAAIEQESLVIKTIMNHWELAE